MIINQVEYVSVASGTDVNGEWEYLWHPKDKHIVYHKIFDDGSETCHRCGEDEVIPDEVQVAIEAMELEKD